MTFLKPCIITNAIVGLRSRIDKGAVIQVGGLPRSPWESMHCPDGSLPAAGCLVIACCGVSDVRQPCAPLLVHSDQCVATCLVMTGQLVRVVA